MIWSKENRFTKQMSKQFNKSTTYYSSQNLGSKVFLMIFALLFLLIPINLFAQDRGSGNTSDGSSRDGSLGNRTDLMEDGELFELFEDSVLILRISARILNEDKAPIWNVDLQRTTILGRGVSVRLQGGNLTLEAEFKPLKNEAGNLLLSADSQTWLQISNPNSAGETTPIYQNMINTLPIEFGEPIIFYPLGMGSERANGFNLEIEIMVTPYLDSLENE
jgi:hypothetical protein